MDEVQDRCGIAPGFSASLEEVHGDGVKLPFFGEVSRMAGRGSCRYLHRCSVKCEKKAFSYGEGGSRRLTDEVDLREPNLVCWS